MIDKESKKLKGVSGRNYRCIYAIQPLEGYWGNLRIDFDNNTSIYGRYKKYIEENEKFLPRVIISKEIKTVKYSGKRWSGEGEIISTNVELFQSFVGRLTILVCIKFLGRIEDLTSILEDLHYKEFFWDSNNLNNCIFKIFDEFGLLGKYNEINFGIESHLVVLGNFEDRVYKPKDNIVKKTIYRNNLPVRDDIDNILFPPELNRRAETVGAVGPLVTYLAGQQIYLEHTLILCAIQIVGDISHLREIRKKLFEMHQSISDSKNVFEGYKKRRVVVAQILEVCSELELNLSFGIEALHDILSFIPALRVENYYNSFLSVLNARERTGIVSIMIARLKSAADSEMSSIRIYERKYDETKRKAWEVAIGFISAIAIPLGIVFGFFGMNAAEIDSSKSFLSFIHYGRIYYVIGLIYFGALILLFSIWVYFKKKLKQKRSRFVVN